MREGNNEGGNKKKKWKGEEEKGKGVEILGGGEK